MNSSRPVVGTIALGCARGSFENALKFCRTHEQGSKRLIDYKDIQMELADMAIQIMASRSMIWNCFNYFRIPQSMSSAAKVFASDTAYKVTGQAMDLLGEYGYMQSTGVERFWRDARLTQIYEGTNQVNRLAVIEHHWKTDFDPVT
jgi:alkylation response protein AidB-like acyl-CoA dehydrogenase